MWTKSLSKAILGKFERSLYFVELKYLRILLVGVKIAKIDSVWQCANKKILIRRNLELNSTNSTNSANLCNRPQKIPVQRAFSILAGKTMKNYASRRNTHIEENIYHKKEFKVQRGTSILTARVGSRVMPDREGCSSHQLATSSFCFLCHLPVNIVCAYKSVVVSKSTLLLKTKVMRAFVNERSPQTKKDGLLCLFRDIIH